MELTPNMFTSYTLTECEEKAGLILSSEQRAVIQNRLAVVATEKVNLKYDVANPSSFVQSEAYKRGEIDALQYILDSSDYQLTEQGQVPHVL